ncbi:hypothetical protein [Halococcus sp. PRR34]|uniref:hypothetical protein n=1 Tax=Halococcus sp. PRR34 TaxID=3020830 RepID=UPI0023614AFD|nr:hypothetical protein [Halococcus sp. PRR34]
MEHRVDRKIVGMGAMIAVTSIGLGLMMGATIGFSAEYWWVGVTVAIATGVLSAAAERSRAGLWIATVVALVGIAALGVVGASNAFVPGVIAIVMVGLGVGTACNRFVFGVLRPTPEVYRDRMRSTR